MSVADNYMPVRQLGNGSTVDYSENWQIISPTFLKVELHAVADGTITPQTLGSDYTLVYSSAGFTVTFNTAPTNSYYVVIYRNVTINQGTPIKTSQGFQGDVIELALDKLTVISQDLKNDSDRSLKFPVGIGVSEITLPVPVANATLAFNGTADALITGATLGEIAAAAQNAQDAEEAKDDAEAALSAFQSQYLGVSATDPTQTPDGDPLAEGMLYWNSTSKALKIYNGSAWESYPLPPDGSITTDKYADESVTEPKMADDSVSLRTLTDALRIGLAQKAINGLTISNNGTDATNDLDIAAGDCWSSDRAAWMNLATGLTKQTDAAFAEGTNQGGMLNGDTRPADGFLYAWAISKDDGTVDIGFTDEDTTGDALTVGDLPSGFTKLRYIGSWAVASSALAAMYQEGDIVRYNARVLDYNATTGIPTTPTSTPISVPSVLCEVELGVVLSNSSTRWIKILDSMSIDTGTPSATDCDLAVGANGINSVVQITRLSEAASIKLHSNGSTATVLNIQTMGWRDIRRGEFS